jgi:hypothetical protein
VVKGTAEFYLGCPNVAPGCDMTLLASCSVEHGRRKLAIAAQPPTIYLRRARVAKAHAMHPMAPRQPRRILATLLRRSVTAQDARTMPRLDHGVQKQCSGLSNIPMRECQAEAGEAERSAWQAKRALGTPNLCGFC